MPRGVLVVLPNRPAKQAVEVISAKGGTKRMILLDDLMVFTQTHPPVVQSLEGAGHCPVGHVVAALGHVPSTDLQQEIIHGLGPQFLHVLIRIQAGLIVHLGLPLRV